MQPQASTFILTGFPDFETALQAIREQLDDYFSKPADIRDLVRIVKERPRQPNRLRDQPAKELGR
jgi:ActR/RegA family two-component response regulator